MSKRSFTTQEIFEALNHPIRRDIIRLVRQHEPISPRQLTDLVGDKLSNVAYHCRILAQSEMLLLTETRPVRGSTEHFYKAKPLGADWAEEALRAGD